MKIKSLFVSVALSTSLMIASSAFSQIGKRFPSERKVVKDPVTGTMLTELVE